MSSRQNGGHGHTSRRDNQSISSTHSSGRSERGTRQQAHNPAVESAVTRLLVSIKQLLESLTFWSQLKIDENQVSDVYVRLGNDFNAAVAAFAGYNIDMTELMAVPDDLRNVLEQCLAEDATPENLEIYLPTVRQIITNLLQGLRGKQSIYRRILSDHRRGSDQPGGSHERTESRSSRRERSSRRADGTHRSQLSRTVADDERPDRDSTVRRSEPTTDQIDGTSRQSGRTSESRNDAVPPTALTSSGESEVFVGGFVPLPPGPQSITPSFEEDNTPTSYESQTRIQQQPFQPTNITSPSQLSRTMPIDYSSSQLSNNTPKPQPPPSVVPASVKRYSLVDKPVLPPSVVIEPSSPNLDSTSSSPAPETPPPDLPPAMANSLAALKKNAVLERRASKRFSTFNISKMTSGSTSRERSVRGHPNRRSLAVSSALTPGELAVLTEVEDEEPHAPLLRQEGSAKSRPISRAPTPEQRQVTPPIPPLPPMGDHEPPMIIEPAAAESLQDKSAGAPTEPPRITVFLQVGREVKKAIVEPSLSFASLRVLFVDKFSYNPGQENFPAIYIRDPSSGVQYELEDTDEVKEKCLLSLNIEPLDQIKQHIDAKISSLSSDIKELRTVVSTNNRSAILPTAVAEPLMESTPLPTRPSDRQFQHVARRISRFVGDPSLSPFTSHPPSANFSYIQAQMTGQSLQPQITGGSVLSDYSSRVVTDLKIQFDEVQNLRRDLATMRQLYTEFMKQTKESLGTLRTQTQSVKQLANTRVGGARGYIDSGKKKLDTRSQNVLTEVEKLLDTVENIKDDVTKRQITPKEQYVKSIKKDIDTVAKELESLKEHIKTVKPMWKKTWEEELQNIVEEQQFLTHQEEFLSDLLEDHKAVVEVYGHIEKVISLRGPGPNGAIKARNMPRNRSFKPIAPDEAVSGLDNVMLEIRGAAVDPDKRMKAIEASQKNREKELAARSDDLHAELADFVGGKKLRMTGGAEEAERVRQKRSEMTLRAMFTGNGSPPPMPSSGLPPTPTS